MTVEKVPSNNATFQKFQVLQTNRNKRYKYNQFIVEGVRNINEAIKNKWKIDSFIYPGNTNLSDWAKKILTDVPTKINYELTPALMQELSGKGDTSELMMIVEMREDTLDINSFSSNPLLALFDRASNHGNLGTIIRSCDACGVECLILTGHAVDLYDPEVVTASMGSFFNVHVVRMVENQQLLDFVAAMKKKYPDFAAVGTTAHREYPIYKEDLTKPLMFMIGNETEGLCIAFKECCDKLITIPMAETSYASSFNVGCAASIMFYEAVRQRIEAGTSNNAWRVNNGNQISTH